MFPLNVAMTHFISLDPTNFSQPERQHKLHQESEFHNQGAFGVMAVRSHTQDISQSFRL